MSDFYTTTRIVASGVGYDCGSRAGGTDCVSSSSACQAGTDHQFASNGDVLAVPTSGSSQNADDDMVTVEIIRASTKNDSEELLGFDCRARSEAVDGSAAAEPIVITVTQSDFAEMPIKPLTPHAGPVDGWLPVNMVNVLYAETDVQQLDTELLGTSVAVRANPVSFHWDLGDGNTITTTNPGEPFPSEAISGTYSQEGWYDITLTTTFSGEFSVAGGAWQEIAGTIEVASDSVPVYSKSLESRLVDGDVPVDEDGDPWIPERTEVTEGPQDPEATHREI